MDPGLSSDQRQSAEKTGGIARGEELPGIRAGSALAARLRGGGEIDIENAVGGFCAAFASADGGGLGLGSRLVSQALVEMAAVCHGFEQRAVFTEFDD